MKTHHLIIVILGALTLAQLRVQAEIKVVIGHNSNDAATPEFRIKAVPPVSATDAATTARFSIVDGTADNDDGLEKLHDGKLPNEEDQPAENFFFAASISGGRLQVDLVKVIAVKQVNTFSWHPSSRAPQVYKLYGSDGSSSIFNARPQTGVDLESCGWKLLAEVNTKPKDQSGEGGQYGVSISDSEGVIGRYRYLLFDIVRTEKDDDWGNTFYSEIDVVDANAPVIAQKVAESAPTMEPLVFNSADGKYEITILTKDAPLLRVWAETKLGPTLAEWYPKIVETLPSEGFVAPTHFSITLKPMDGVAFTTGRKVTANSTWVESELNREAVGALVHEAVHVAQQYGRGAGHNPGWLVEGLADYIRWFKYEPQSHGADIVWMRQLRNFSPRYDASYRVTANFLNWVTEKYDANLVSQLNAALRAGKYDDALWKQYTGKSVPELGEEWRADIEAQLAKPKG